MCFSLGSLVEIGTQVGQKGWLKTNLVKGDLTSPFTIEFNLTESIQKLSFQEAGDYTAKIIASKYNNLHLCLSGGLDSEYVAKVLVRNKIPFTPVILLTQHNSLEAWYAYKFCHDNAVTPTVLDVRSINENFSLVKSLLSKSAKLQVPPHPSLVSNVIAEMLPDDAHLITGFGESIDNSKEFNNVVGNIAIINDWDFYFELEYRDQHPGAFLTYTPEIFYAQNFEINENNNSQLAKAEMYTLLPRPKFWYNPLYFDIPDINILYKNLSKRFYKPDEVRFWAILRKELLKKLVDY